jgi:hypothetical protein
MIERAGQFAMENFFLIGIVCVVILSYIGYRADRKMREEETANRQLAEVDNYNAEEEIGI